MASKWMFGCELGFTQGTCNQYERDPQSRGATQQMGGCASCKHRRAYNSQTAMAEAAHTDARHGIDARIKL